MHKEEVLEKINELGRLAVIRGGSAEEAINIVDALVVGGVTGIEITFTTPDAVGVVHTLANKYGDNILLGMGTLTKPESAGVAKQAGAQFLVSPHID